MVDRNQPAALRNFDVLLSGPGGSSFLFDLTFTVEVILSDSQKSDRVADQKIVLHVLWKVL